VSWSLDDIFAKTTVNGTAANNTLTGTNESDDNLYGLGGNDTLVGHAGDDILQGGLGDDSLYGGRSDPRAENGNDRYLWSKGDGNDFIREVGQSLTEVDRLELADVASTDVALSRHSGSDDLVVEIVSTGERITIDAQFNNSAYRYGVEMIEFSDGVIWTLDEILTHTRVDGTAGNETLNGTGYRDNLYGLDGNDVLYGLDGADSLYGGLGNDTLKGGGHADTFIFKRNFDADQITDFQDNLDTIELRDLSMSSVSDALSHAVQSGSNVVFDFGQGDTLTVLNTTISVLGDDISIV
jgi:Ca2+-binding RTX toxin-like protein